jgi:hypothetical protein
MKVIALTESAYAFEPDCDDIGTETADRLRKRGLNDAAIDNFLRYRRVRNEPPTSTGEDGA